MSQIASRYSAEVEGEVIGWFKQLIQLDIEPGMHKVEKALKNGQALVKYDTSALNCFRSRLHYYIITVTHLAVLCARLTMQRLPEQPPVSTEFGTRNMEQSTPRNPYTFDTFLVLGVFT